MERYKKTLLASAVGVALLGAGPIFSASAADGDKLTALTFKYTGAGCSDWSNAQDTQASCVDYRPVTADEVYIQAFDPATETAVWYEGVVEVGKTFTVDALNGAAFALTGRSVELQISDLQGRLLQRVEIGIDEPLRLVKDDLYGGLKLDKLSYKFKVPKHYAADQYIVGFGADVDWDTIEDYADYWKPYGVKATMELPLVNALVMKVPSFVTAADLASDPDVVTVRLNRIISAGTPLNAQGRSFIRPSRNHNRQRVRYEYPWSIAKLFDQPYDYLASDSPTVLLDEASIPDVIKLAMKAVDGADLRIAVFDTGIEDHHDRADRVDGGLNVVTPDANGKFHEGKPGDDNGHGTHVGGILVALLDKKLELGKNAPVKLFAVKMLDQYATGSLSNIIMGLQWAIDKEVDIVNMSLGYKADDPLVRLAIEKAADAGILMIASSGNRTNYDDSVVLEGMAEGGAAEGGAAEGGAAEGGAAEGGAAEGGAAEGGAAEGGAAEGGAAEGGAAEGGAAEGGAAEGGAAEGGASCIIAMAEGGAAEGGAAEGGAAEGGAAEGGAAEGGAAEGGAAEGGAAEGGAAEGGAAEGGASGNDCGSLALYDVMYPARYAPVIAVGASDRWGEMAAFSNWGPELDLLAPGVDIFSWDITNDDIKEGYGATNGTSMATPHVTAAVAMLKALDPTLDVDQIRQILRQTADYSANASVGDLDLVAALDEVLSRLLGVHPAAYDYHTLEGVYKDAIKAKLERFGY